MFLGRLWSSSRSVRRRKMGASFAESLEPRTLLSAAPITLKSGRPTLFRDADGTLVSATLRGPGSGTITLTNGESTGGDIESLILNGTTARSSLTIRTLGGSTPGTTVHQLEINGASRQSNILGLLNASSLALNSEGEFTSAGGLGKVIIGDIGANATFDVDGPLKSLLAGDIEAGAQISVHGKLGSFTAFNLGDGAEVFADTIGSVSLLGRMDGGVIHAGTGGLKSGYFRHVENSLIRSDSTIGNITIAGNFIGSTIAANLEAGTDGEYGTLDDYVYDSDQPGTIKSVKIHGSTESDDDSWSRIVASGKIGKVSGWGTTGDSTLEVSEFTATSFVPLNVSQESAMATGVADDQIWIAVFGQLIPIPSSGEVPPPGPSYYLVADQLSGGNPIPQSTSGMAPGPGTPSSVTVPSSTLADWGSHLKFPVPPKGYQFTGRIVISVGAPVQAQINADGSISAPNGADPTDPSNGTIYDFLEFTIQNSAAGVQSVDMDTSIVDAFGLPMKLELLDTSGQPFNFNFTGNLTTGSNVIAGIPDTSNLGTGNLITGDGIPAGATIQSIVNSTATSTGSITLNYAATKTASKVTLISHAGGPVGVEGIRQEILAPTGDNSYLAYILGQISDTSDAARPFLESYANQTTAPVTLHSGMVQTATNAGPIQITSSNHGLQSGDVVTISGVLGNTAANGTFAVTRVDDNNFTLNGSQGNGNYTGEGVWYQGTIIAATNAGPIVITTSTPHGLETGDLVGIEGVVGNSGANGLFEITRISDTQFSLNGSHGTEAYSMGGYITVYDSTPLRLISPKDVVEAINDPVSADPLNNYYNEMIDAFFLQYYSGTIGHNVGGGKTFTLVSTASGAPVTYSGVTTKVGSNYVLRLNATTGSAADKAVNYDIYYPFWETNLPDADVYQPIFYIEGTTAPSWIINANQQYESASSMVFACDVIFADNTLRFTGTSSKVLGDLEDSISAAFNRGIVLNDASTWGDQSTWFQTTTENKGTYNYWVAYWHQSGLTYGNLAYAFPYDDKFGDSTNLDLSNVGSVNITLGAWSTAGTMTATTTVFENFPVAAEQGGEVTLAAKVTGTTTPTGTVTFYINGTPINSSNNLDSPPIQPVTLDANGVATLTAFLPALPDGSISHTYTVTAVYSGDSDQLPSIASQSLPLTGINGAFPVSANTLSGAAGSTVTVTAVVPGDNPSGSVNFSFARQDGSEPQHMKTVTVTGNTVTATVQIPDVVIAILGAAQNGSSKIQNVANVVGLENGQGVSNLYIQEGATITGYTPPILTLSQPATETAVVMLKSGNQTFQANLTQGSTEVTGVLNVSGLTEGATIEGPYVPEGTTIQQIQLGEIELDQPVSVTANIWILVSGAGQVFRIEAIYIPETGPALLGMTPFTITG